MYEKQRICVLLGTAIILMAAATTTYAKTQECTASWYGEELDGELMANQKPFDMNNPNHLAHKTLPLGTRLRVTNLQNGKSITPTVTDRGPYIEGRCVDVSEAGARLLGFFSQGHTRVRIQVIE